MGDSMEKALAEATIRKKKITRNFTSTGIRELDEMLGGGFMPGTLTLMQQDLGSGGEIIIGKILELQLSLSNVVLVILSDPTASHLEGLIEDLACENLIVLNLVEQSKRNMNILLDKHEISLKIRESRRIAVEKLDEMRKKEQDEDLQLFTLMVSLNPIVLNLSQDKVIRILNDQLMQTIDQKTIDLVLLSKNILSRETNARIQSLCHGVIDLRSYFEGVQKKNEISILKMIGRYYDVKIEPYIISFDDKTDKYHFIIKSAFLTSFETFRNLLTWNEGSVALSEEPYVLTPITYINSLLEMPFNIDRVKGKDELIEKAQGIGRRLAIMVERLYFVEDIALFKSTLQTASLLGWGDAKIKLIEIEENLIELTHLVNKNFNPNVYDVFLMGYYRGMVKRTLQRGIRYVRVTQDKDNMKEMTNAPFERYNIRIRLKRINENAEFA